MIQSIPDATILLDSLSPFFSTGRSDAIFILDGAAMAKRSVSTRHMKAKERYIPWMYQAWCLNKKLCQDVATFIENRDLREMMGREARGQQQRDLSQFDAPNYGKSPEVL